MSDEVKTQVTKVKLPMYRYSEDPFPPLQREGTRRVYPYTMQDDLTDELIEREFTAVVLDNGLLRLTILPDFGGHIISVRDLKNDCEVFYHNIPLKFGLIALRGAWYSGGLEFNFPQVGHTVTTNDPLAWQLTENPDGSATLHLGGIERLTRMAWTASVTLHPNDLRLHTHIWLFNRTPFWHRIYFWTNVGVTAREDFRFLLPCTKVFSWWWGAQGVANFPIQDGTDLSLYVAHKRPTDLFAKDLRADWFGCYYEQLDYGVLHYANRFEVHGRKLWTWGTAEHGAWWINLLSDKGEPYCEIQSGRFVHQGIHRLMPPRAVETWREAWFPVWGIGGVVHASDRVALNADRIDNQLRLRLFALVPIEDAAIVVAQGGKVLERTQMSLPIGEPVATEVALQGNEPISVVIQEGKQTALQVRLVVEYGTRDTEHRGVLADYSGESAPHIGLPEQPMGEPATPTAWLLKARDHEERNELDAAAECYRKAIALDPQCVAAMSGLAQWHLKRGEFRQGREWAQKALQVDPQNEDALWWKAVASYWDTRRGTWDTGIREGEAPAEPIAYLWALTRSNVYAAAALALLGEFALRRDDYRSALELFVHALERNPQDSKALALAAFAARKLGEIELAKRLLQRCEKVNPLEPLLWSERHFLPDKGQEARDTETALKRIFVDDALWLDAACDYEQVGAWGTVSVWLAVAKRHLESDGNVNPMVLYHAAYAMWQMGKLAEAMSLIRSIRIEGDVSTEPKAVGHPNQDGSIRSSPSQTSSIGLGEGSALTEPGIVREGDAEPKASPSTINLKSTLFTFPHRHEDAKALQTALTLDPNDALAHYLFGTWLASVGRWDEAIAHWRKVTDEVRGEGRKASETTLQVLAWRNIGLMHRLVRKDLLASESAYDKAIELLSNAQCSLSPYEWRLWLERDVVLAASGQHEKRVQLFERAPEMVCSKSQVVARWAEACVRVGDYARAIELLSQGNFKPWEGEFALRQIWKEANMQLGHQAMAKGDFVKAKEHFEAAADYPLNLNVGRPHWTDDADALFWAGWCALKIGDRVGARKLLEQAVTENQPPNAQTAEFKLKATELLKQI